MPRYVGIFNLPALMTCTPSDWCKENCYALQGRFLWKTIKEAHYRNYVKSLDPDFIWRMIQELRRRKSLLYIRVHISGDFYNADYVIQWAAIASAFPNIIFRTNTRRQDLIPLMKEAFPKNFVVRESIDITRKSMGIFPVAAIKGTPGSNKFFVCQDNCEKCNFSCWHNPNIHVVTSKIR